MTTTEHIKVIAKFMHLATAGDLVQSPITGKYEVPQFDSDWNWLMLVVERIESLGYIPMMGVNSCVITARYPREVNALSVQNGSSKIEATFKAVIQFIIWLNSKNTIND